jgi:cystathionine gamma-synthase
VDLVPAGDLDALGRALEPQTTRLVWLETPANPTCEVTDLAAAVAAARTAGARVAVDNTVPTPLLTRPLELGADYVVHSATKALNGHSDVLAGALVTRRDDEVWQRVRYERGARGAIPGPFEAWLLLRGMRTLALRLQTSCRNAQLIAEALARHPEVVEVCYPGLPSHPGHAVARRQMGGGFGAILSARFTGGEARARLLAGALRLFTQATSLGGVESLVEHRFSVEGEGSLSPPDLLRFSIGIEAAADLVGDLEHALAATSRDAEEAP